MTVASVPANWEHESTVPIESTLVVVLAKGMYNENIPTYNIEYSIHMDVSNTHGVKDYKSMALLCM